MEPLKYTGYMDTGIVQKLCFGLILNVWSFPPRETGSERVTGGGDHGDTLIKLYLQK